MKAKPCLLIAILGLVALSVIACNSTSSPPADVGFAEQALPTTLERGCSPSTLENVNDAGLAVGEMAIDFTLNDTYGNEYVLSQLLVEKPVVMIFGSFT